MEELTLITAPYTNTIVTLEEIKNHLRIVSTDDDQYIEQLGIAATAYIEAVTNRQLITATYKLSVNKLTEEIFLPKGQTQEIEHIKYLVDGELQTMDTADYQLVKTDPAYIKIEDIPTADDKPDAYQITFVCGYGNRTDVPDTLKIFALKWITEQYDKRDLSMPAMYQQLPYGHRILYTYRIYY